MVESASMPERALIADVDGCRALLDDLVDLYELARISCAIDSGGGTVVVTSSRGRQAVPQLPIGCLAKVYTAYVVERVCKENGISLDTPAKEICRNFGVASQHASQMITLRHLLSHSSGLDTEGITGYVAKREDFWEQLKNAKQLFEPGTNRSYCSVGFIAACTIAESVAQSSWWQLVADLIDVDKHVLANDGCNPLCLRNPRIMDASVVRSAGIVCSTAAFGTDIALNVSQLASFGRRILSESGPEGSYLGWWRDGENGYCAGGTGDDLDSRVQILPDQNLSVAAVAEGPLSSAVHDFFRQLIGSHWDGFISPKAVVDRHKMLQSLVGQCYESAFMTVRFDDFGSELNAEIRIGRSGESTWVGKKEYRRKVDLDIAESGFVAGEVHTDDVTFKFTLEALDYDGKIDYLIFNRKMLLVRGRASKVTKK